MGRPLARHAAPAARWVRPGGVTLALAALAAGIGELAAGPQAALGAACGGIVASGYSWSFLQGHLARTTRGGFDAALAGGALTRLVVAGAVAVAMWMVGRPALVAYLLSFGVVFALVVARELPRMARQTRTRPGSRAEVDEE